MGGGHAMISKIMGINTAGAVSVLLTSGEESVCDISDVGRVTAIISTEKLVYQVRFVTITFDGTGRK